MLVLKRIQLSLLLCFVCFFFFSFYIYNNYFPTPTPSTAPAFVTVEVLAPSLGGGVG